LLSVVIISAGELNLGGDVGQATLSCKA